VARVLFLFIAVWAVVTGVLELGAGFRLRKVIKGEWWLVLSGLLRLAFGVILFARRGTRNQALAWITGVYALAYGIVMIGLSLRLKRFHADLSAGRIPTPRGWVPRPA
jgi:uncharacterized membrane protein HdeD (DUF308 family)